MKEEICKKGIKKKLIRVILSLATVVTFLHLSSINVYAAEVTVSTWGDFTTALSNSPDGTVIKLGDNLTADSTAEFNASDKTITIDLNGKKIDLNGDKKIKVVAGTLTIKDSTGKTGTITGSKVEALSVGSDAMLVLESGSITNSKTGIYLNSSLDSSAQFVMSGGYIKDNETNISGANITTAANVKLLGGEITGGSVGVNVGALTLGGSIKIKDNIDSEGEDVSLKLVKSVMTSGDQTEIQLAKPINGMEVCVYSVESEIVILADGDDVQGSKQYFYSADPYREIVYEDSVLKLRDKRASNLNELKNHNSVKLDDFVSIREASRIANEKGNIPSHYRSNFLVVYQKSTGGNYKVCVFTDSAPGYESHDYPLAELIRLADTNDKTVYVVGSVLKHTWEYSVGTGEEVNKLTASCNGSCGRTHNVLLTLNANDANYSGNPYTGASLGGTSDWTGEGVDLIEPEIKYVGRGSTTYEESKTAPTAIGTYTAKITVEGHIATKDFAITAKTSSSDSESTKVFVDLDTNKSEVPYGTVFMHNKDNVRNIFDMKVHSVDARTKANQEFLAASYAKNQGKRARVLITTGIYPRNKLYAKDLGDKKFLSFVNLEKKVQPVYAVCYNQTDKAYYLTGTMNANGTAVFPDFIANEATNITVFVLE